MHLPGFISVFGENIFNGAAPNKLTGIALLNEGVLETENAFFKRRLKIMCRRIRKLYISKKIKKF